LLGYVLISIVSFFAIFLSPQLAWRIFIAADRAVNAALGGCNRETLSSRSYRGSLRNVKGWCILCKILDAFQKDHCKNSEGI
jgi:hypothetical protein